MNKGQKNCHLNHPERKPDEIFLANFNVENRSYRNVSWSTKRPGRQAYSSTGQPLDPINKVYPIFVKKWEIAASERLDSMDKEFQEAVRSAE